MGSFRSKEDDVAKISTSIFVSNFPDSVSAKDLFHSCKQYGHVVDSFIPMKRLKDGKRFGFVRFINVFNVERLVNNLCTIWLNRCKLHANIARFNRDQKNGNKYKTANQKKHEGRKNTFYDPSKEAGTFDSRNSFVNVLKGTNMVKETDSSPVIVLEEDCLNSKDLSNSLIGRVKDVGSLSNLKKVLCNEGFDNIFVRYMGELWVLLEFDNTKAKELFRDNVEREDNRNSDGAKTNSTGSRKFKMSEIPRTGGSILSVIEEIVKILWKRAPGDDSNRMRNFVIVNNRLEILGKLQQVNKAQASEVAQKAKIKWRKKQSLIFKVDFEKAYDSVRWDFLDDILVKFGFGIKWRGWIQNCLNSSKGSILVNRSPTEEFQFYKGLKQGMILIFDTLVHVMECFYRVSGLRINLCKSKIMGIHVDADRIKSAASKLGCLVLNTPFLYLGTKVGENMSRVHAWKELASEISSWRMWITLIVFFYEEGTLGDISVALRQITKRCFKASSMFMVSFGCSVRWYLRAAEGGHVHAMYEVAMCYASGRGIAQDRQQSRK
ncbi:nucleotide-binding alpha-beta plait domain-containing protein [Tanacetum coccineum]